MNPRARSRSHRTHSGFIVVSGACSGWAKGASDEGCEVRSRVDGAAACASLTRGQQRRDGGAARMGLMGRARRVEGATVDVMSEVILDCEQRSRSPGNTIERAGIHTTTHYDGGQRHAGPARHTAAAHAAQSECCTLSSTTHLHPPTHLPTPARHLTASSTMASRKDMRRADLST